MNTKAMQRLARRAIRSWQCPRVIDAPGIYPDRAARRQRHDSDRRRHCSAP